MPVVAVALAAGSFAAGATAFAAATTTIGMIAAGASMVGAAMTIVGTVTGNEKLTKWGAIIGIAGNVGTGLINSAAEAGATAAASAGADAASGAAGAAGDTLGAAAGDVAAKTAGDAIGSGVETFAVATPPPASPIGMGNGMLGAAPNAASAAKGVAEAAAPQAASAAKAAAGTADAFSTTATKAGQAAAEGASKVFDAGQTAVGQAGMISPNADISAYIPESTGMLGKIGGAVKDMSAWAKANPELAKAALNGISGMASGLVPSAKDKALMEQYRQQTALGQQQADALARRARWGSGRI